MLTSADSDGRFPSEAVVKRYFPMTTAEQAFPAQHINLPHPHSFREFVITQPLSAHVCTHLK